MMRSYDPHAVVRIPMLMKQHNSSFHQGKQPVLSLQEHHQHAGLADSRSEGAIGELEGFSYTHFVISGTPVCASTQSQRDWTAPPDGGGMGGLTLSVAWLLVAQISLFDAWPHTAPSTLRYKSPLANDNTSSVLASGGRWAIVGQWQSLKMSPVRPCLSPAFIMEPFNNDTMLERSIQTK